MKVITHILVLVGIFYGMLCSCPSLGWSVTRTKRLFPKYRNTRLNEVMAGLPPAKGRVTVKIDLDGRFHARVTIGGKVQAKHDFGSPSCSNSRVKTYTVPSSAIVSGRMSVGIYLYKAGRGGSTCNLQIVTITVTYTEDKTTKFPDLVITDLVMKEHQKVRPGGYIPVTFRIKNQGKATAPKGVLLGFRRMNGSGSYGAGEVKESLAPGQTSDWWLATFRVPDNARSSFLFYAHVDLNYRVTESNENNNISYFSRTVSSFPAKGFPDLKILSMTAPSTAKAGQKISVSFQLRNNRSADAGYFYVRFFLGTKALYVQGTKTELKRASLIRIKGNTTHTLQTVSLTIPSSARGTRFLHMFVDQPSSKVEEWDESNNVKTLPLSIAGAPLPDLTVSALSHTSAPVKPLAKVSLSYRVWNQATHGATKPFALKFYLSKNSTYSANDLYLGQVQINSLKAKAYYPTTANGTFTVTIPAKATPGTRHFIAYVDSAKQLQESNESNNIKSTPIAIVTTPPVGDPDLEMSTWATTTSIAGKGSAVDITFRIKNNRAMAAKAFDVSFYYSNATSTNNLILLGTHSFAGLSASGTSIAVSKRFVMTDKAVYGTGYIHYFIDSKSTVKESDETNNRGMKKVNITSRADLAVDFLSAAPTTTAPGQHLLVTFRIRNLGRTRATGFTTYFYYSRDSKISTLDRPLGQIIMSSGIDAGAYAPSRGGTSARVALPLNIAIGAGYIGILVDYGQKTTDINRANNSKAFKVTIQGPRTIDLVAVKLTTTPTVLIGGVATVFYEIANRGTADSAAFSVSFRYSNNNYISKQDPELSLLKIPSLKAKQSKRGTLSLKIPATLSSRTAYLGMIVDSKNQIKEGIESNNIISTTIQLVTNNKTDKDKDGYTSDKDCNDNNSQIHPGAVEKCDNQDNDCDGKIDEGLSQTCYDGPAGTAGRGLCKAGVRLCFSGRWGRCQGQRLPSKEICDNQDNDCDGRVDLASCRKEAKPEVRSESAPKEKTRPEASIEKNVEHTADAGIETIVDTTPDSGSERQSERKEKLDSSPDGAVSSKDDTVSKESRSSSEGRTRRRDKAGPPAGVGCEFMANDSKLPSFFAFLLLFFVIGSRGAFSSRR